MSFSEPGGPVLPADELSALNNRMQENADLSYWKLGVTHSANDPPKRLKLLAMILSNLWSRLQLTTLKNSVRPFADTDDAVKFLENMDAQERQEWDSEIIQAVMEGEWSRIIGHKKLTNDAGSFAAGYQASQNVPIVDSHVATTKSWDIPYEGHSHTVFYDFMTAVNKKQNLYAPYISIVQSSGMGKSRMIDELAKLHLVIPLNLRPPNDTGFPATDQLVRNWFGPQQTRLHAAQRAYAFLCALLEVAHQYLRQIDDHIKQLGLPISKVLPATLAGKFRLLMTHGQKFDRQNSSRTTFYTKVTERAQTLLSKTTVSGGQGQATADLNGEDVKRAWKPWTDIDSLGNGSDGPKVILAFDEAHVLLETSSSDPSWSQFSELRRVLKHLDGRSLFSVFLTTVGKMYHFTPAPEHDKSARVQRGIEFLPTPFTELGFDQLAEKVTDGLKTLEDVSKTEFMVKLGRPLFGGRFQQGNSLVQESIVAFAAEKLICARWPRQRGDPPLEMDQKLACMAVRLALQFNARGLAVQARELSQVEKHLRVCLSITPEFGYATTVAPSEPILAQAAFTVMTELPNFDFAHSLAAELEHPAVSTGDRGELFTLAVLLRSRDDAACAAGNPVISVVEFIKHLFNPKDAERVLNATQSRFAPIGEEDIPFKTQFAKSKIYFHHFVRHQDRKMFSRDYLWRLAVRGAAIYCAVGETGADIIIPFLYEDTLISRMNVSAIIIQCKNDKDFQETPVYYLFDPKMKPSELGIVRADERDCKPVIRMTFALAGVSSSLTALTRPDKRSDRIAANTEAVNIYTSYDIWVQSNPKATSKTFAAISQKEDEAYFTIIRANDSLEGAYTAGIKKDVKGAERLTRNMNPGTSVDGEHWKFVAPLPGARD